MLVVSTPATVTAMTTLTMVKREMKIETGDDDTWLRAQIDSASATACQILGVAQAEDGTRTLGRETLIETIDRRACWPWTRGLVPIVASRENEAKIVLARRPIVSVASVTEDGVAADPAEYQISAVDGTLRRFSNDLPISWPSSLIVATYVAGWLMPGETGRNLPTDWEDAVISAVKQSWFARTRDPSVKSQGLPGLIQTDYFFGTPGQDGPLPQDAMATLRFGRDISI